MIVLFVIMTIFAQMWLSLTYKLNPTDNKSYHSSSWEGYLRAYTMMLGGFSYDEHEANPTPTCVNLTVSAQVTNRAGKDEHEANPVIIPLFIVYTFVVTIVLLNILIAIVSDSYQSVFFSSELIHGKARIMFYSELHSIKHYFKLKQRGEGGNLCCNRFIPQLFISAAVIYAVVGTTTIKISQLSAFSPSCQLDAPSIRRFNIEAGLVFLALFYWLYLANGLMISLLAGVRPADSMASCGTKPLSSIKIKLYCFVVKLVSCLSFTFDSLNDETEKRALGQEGDDKKSTPFGLHTYKKMHRSMRRDKKDLKQELKTTVEQIQMSLQETENRMQQRMLDVEDRIAYEVQNRLEVLLKRLVVNEQSQKNDDSGDLKNVTDDDISTNDSWEQHPTVDSPDLVIDSHESSICRSIDDGNDQCDPDSLCSSLEKDMDSLKNVIEMLEVEDASDDESDDDLKSIWRNLRPSEGEWMEPVDYYL